MVGQDDLEAPLPGKTKQPTLTERVNLMEEQLQYREAQPQAAAQDPEDAARFRVRQAEIRAVESAQVTTQLAVLATIRQEADKQTPSTQRLLNLSNAFAALNSYRY